MTVEEAKKYLRAHWEEGVDCPACGQLVKKYRRKLNSGMARCLITMLRAEQDGYAEDGWISVNRVLAQYRISAMATEYSKLAGWGLIESRGDRTNAAKSAGMWRVTQDGQYFARRQLEVPKYVYVFDGRFLGTDGEPTDIVAALGSHFNYHELMKGI